MHIKKLFLGICLVGTFGIVHADNYDNLVFRVADGTKTWFPSTVVKIIFENGNVVASASNGTSATLPLSSMSAMYFSLASADNGDGTAGIENAVVDKCEDSAVVYNIMGVKVASGAPFAQLRRSILPGLYIVKAGGKTYKVKVK